LRDLTAQSRFFVSVLRFALLAALAAALAVAPGRLRAQQSAPTAQASPAAATNGTAKPESKQEENNVYLHAPVVRSISRMLHLSVGITAEIFEGINFAILALAIGIPLFRWLPKTIRKRGEKIREEIESARKVTEDAGLRLSAIEAKLSGLDGEIAQIRAQVEEESKQDEARIKSTIGEESERIVATAEQEIGSAAAQARRSLRHFAADLAIEQATKKLLLTPETDQALIAEFLRDVAGNGATKGGQN
jgi:F-type H+-transporting ATPase subunit b